jgi:glycosyltransferase involved in cell wall biosynthesis
VIDNGSEDGTVEILNEFDERVILLGRFHHEFREGLKSIPFNWANTSRVYPRADWWCVMDADEIYYENPRQFLSKVPPQFGRVCTNTVEFIGLQDGMQPFKPESYSHYMPLNWSESRFYRNVKSLKWSNYKDNGPSGIGATYHSRIKVLHFPFRSISQIKKRMDIRNQNRNDSGISWSNSNYKDIADLHLNYNANNKFQNNGKFLFSESTTNFLTSPRDRLSKWVKIALYWVGFFR